MTNAGPEAKKLSLTVAPGEETNGTASFQNAIPHYHSHSSGALQTMALNIHGNPLSSVTCNKSASAQVVTEHQQSSIPMYIHV